MSGSRSVTLILQIASSFLFRDGIETFFGHQFSMWQSTKLFSSIFDLGPLTPKIYSPKLYRPLFADAATEQIRTHRPLLPWRTSVTAVAMATKSGLGADLRLPACLLGFLPRHAMLRRARYCQGKSSVRPSVCRSVCDVEVFWSHRLEYFEKISHSDYYLGSADNEDPMG